VLIFFDCEFTELGIDPKLISIGLVSENGTRELYAELCDTYQPSDCSDFVREAVLPHLEGGDARMTMRELSVRLVDWLIAFGEPVQLATDSLSWDWPWIGELYAEAGEGTDWPAHMTTHGKAEVFRPANVDGRPYVLTQSPSFNLAIEAAFASGLRRHHALDDAKANRLGWQALGEGNKAMQEALLIAQVRLFNPRGYSRPRWFRQFKLYRALRFSLDNHCPRANLIPMCDISNMQADKITTAQLAIDCQVKHG